MKTKRLPVQVKRIVVGEQHPTTGEIAYKFTVRRGKDTLYREVEVHSPRQADRRIDGLRYHYGRGA